MNRKSTAGALAALLLVTGCVLPVDIEINTDGSSSHGIRGSGQAATLTRAVQGFDSIEASGIGRVVVERTGRERVVLTADDNLLEHFEVQVRDGTLYLGPRSGVSLNPVIEPVYRVEVARLEQISGSGVVTFEVRLGQQRELRVYLSGVSGLDVRGSVGRLRVELSGVSWFRGLDLVSRVARIVASGVSWAEVYVTDTLEAYASGSSSIRYRGDPHDIIVQTSGVSTVEPF